LLLQRAQFQEQKISRIQAQLDEVRKQIAAETARQANANDRLAKIEQDISNESDAARRSQLEDMRAGLKMIAGNGPDQQLRARESELSNSLDTEQAVLGEFNEKLDALARQMEAAAAK
jgi:chromosome segregation ATPase